LHPLGQFRDISFAPLLCILVSYFHRSLKRWFSPCSLPALILPPPRPFWFFSSIQRTVLLTSGLGRFIFFPSSVEHALGWQTSFFWVEVFLLLFLLANIQPLWQDLPGRLSPTPYSLFTPLGLAFPPIQVPGELPHYRN